MICPKCKGTGEENIAVAIDPINGIGEYYPKCKNCNGTGEVTMTNEEWRKTCSTEEYATWLWKNIDNGEVIVLWKKYGCPMHKDNNGVSRADYTEAMKKWLKEVHNG